MSRMPAVRRALIVLILSGAIGSQSSGQEASGSGALAGGGVAVRLDATARHTMIAVHADGVVELHCVQGDEHEALEAMRRWNAELATELGADRDRLPAGAASGEMRLDRSRRAGADAEGRVLLFTPDPVQPGSSRSHFDTRAFPNLLMEPNINADLPFNDVDATDDALRDLGWRRGPGLESEILYTDPAGEGFNDKKLGAERRAALEFATATWRELLGSRVPAVIDASFLELPCSAAGAALAGAAPTVVYRDFPRALPGTWYPGATAESLVGRDLNDPAAADLVIVFNSAIDEGCLGPKTGWYYGTDGDVPGGRFSFITVTLHEMAHGLGFTGLTDLATGEFFLGFPDIFTRRMFDNTAGATWDVMSKAGRRRSAVRSGEVALDSKRAQRTAGRLLADAAVFELTAPADLAATYAAGTAAFGPPVDRMGLAGELALASDGSASPRLACLPLINPDEIAGRIALIARGDCSFVDKVLNAQDAGAIGVVIMNNVTGGPSNMGGVSDDVEIPSIMVSRELGRALRDSLR